MTYGYPPPPREWRPSEPDDEDDNGRSRREPQPPPTSGRRIPQPPPPAKHVPPTGGLHARPQSPTPYPLSPQAYGTPSRPTSPPPSMRRPPPNNAGGGPPAYPAYPPPVPTSPTPRIPPPPAPPRMPPAPPRAQTPPAPPVRMPPPPAAPRSGPATGALRTGGMNVPTGPRAGGFAAPKAGGASPIGPGPRPTNYMPPTAPNRKPGTRAPVRPAQPTPKRPRGVSFREVPGLLRQLPQHRPWMIAIGAIAIAVVVSMCGLGSWLLFTDDKELVGATPTPESTVVKRDITNRDADPNPLTAADVFPNAEVVVDPKFPYKRIGEAQTAEDCRVGATGEVGRQLQASGCTQVVRASFSTFDNAYFVTGGVFNLTDVAAATKFSTDVKDLIQSGNGRFGGYISDPNVNVVMGRAPTSLAWEVRGHFIVFTVIAKADGSAFAADDPNVKVIVYDILQKYLRDHVLEQWAIDKNPAGSASPSA